MAGWRRGRPVARPVSRLGGSHPPPCPRPLLAQVAEAVLAAHDSGELAAAVAGGHDGYKKWVNSVGKAQGRKGKR